MARHKSLWQRLGETVRKIIPGGKPLPAPSKGPRKPLPERMPGLPPRPKPAQPPRETEPVQPDIWAHGPYPSHWSREEIEFWDHTPNTYRELYTADEWEDLQEAFEKGWLASGLSPAERNEWRDRYYEISDTVKSSFDWEAYREYINAVGSPSGASAA